MSHELRTPLNAVIGAAQLLQAQEEQEAQQPGQAHLVEAIRQSGLNLLGLIENVLDLSRIETGALELAPEDFNLLDCIEAAVATAAVPARIKGLQMASIVDPALPLWRHGDPLRLRQVLLNLLGNAVKFTLRGRGGAARRAGRARRRRCASSSATPASASARPRSSMSSSRSARPTTAPTAASAAAGWAWPSARQLVEAMGGRIAVHSRLGEGSRFDVELTLPPRTQPGPSRRRCVSTRALPRAARRQRRGAGGAACAPGLHGHRCRSPGELRRVLARATPTAPAPWLLVAMDDAEAAGLLDAVDGLLDPQRVIGMAPARSHCGRGDAPALPGAAQRRQAGAALGAGQPARRDGARAAAGQPPVAQLRPTARDGRPQHVLVVEDDRVNQTIVCAHAAQRRLSHQHRRRWRAGARAAAPATTSTWC